MCVSVPGSPQGFGFSESGLANPDFAPKASNLGHSLREQP
jgi:hypothetical protein